MLVSLMTLIITHISLTNHKLVRLNKDEELLGLFLMPFLKVHKINTLFCIYQNQVCYN